MQSCSIQGCESYKTIQSKPVAYFKFPFTNLDLLQVWLTKINQKNFMPTPQDQICSTHFLIEDIEPSSIGRYPVLKPEAVPSVFPERKDKTPEKEAKDIKPDIKPIIKKAQFETVLIPDFLNQIPILPKANIVQSPPTIIPQNVVQLTNKPNILQPTKIFAAPIQIQSKVLPIQTKQIQPKPIQLQRIQLQPQLVKVQPKIQFQAKPIQLQPNSPVLEQKSPVMQQKSPANHNQQKSPMSGMPPNGKLIPLKQINLAQLQEIFGSTNLKTSETPKTVVAKPKVLTKSSPSQDKNSYPDSRRPILKIQINKVNEESTKKPVQTKKTNVSKSKPEEVLIKAMNKSVIFRLDSSGKIVVETKNDPEIIDSDSTALKKPEEIIIEDPKLNSLKSLYNKAQEDCVKLSKKLASLKKRHQEEQEQILKLQGQYSNAEKKIENSYESDISASSVSKKRKFVTKEEEEDEYEKLLREVRKIKEDYDKNVFTKISSKDSVNIKTEEISMDSDTQEIVAILTQDQTINTTMSKKEKRKEVKKNLPVTPKIATPKNKIIMPEFKKSNIIERKVLRMTERKNDEAKFRESPLKNEGEIIGLIDEEDEVNFDSEDEMNFEAEYLDPEFVNC